MRNLAIILISLFPFIGFSQQTSSEKIHPNSKMYDESGVQPFSKIYDKKQPTETVVATITITADHQSINHFELNHDECRIRREYDNPKVYSKIGEEMSANKINRNQFVEVMKNITAASVDQEFILPVFNEEDLKLGYLNSGETPTTPLTTITDDFTTIRIYENPKVYYELKVPTDPENKFFTIHDRPQ
jgi:hypothetical protein